jgi:hypothetical protein
MDAGDSSGETAEFLTEIFEKTVDRKKVLVYYNYCRRYGAAVIKDARVAQWWSIALPRRGSRVRIPSRAFTQNRNAEVGHFCFFIKIYRQINE